jgi:hypothetical protein
MATRCIMPCSLVLIHNECFYCHSRDTITSHQSLYNFGILACPEHKSCAIRDSKAYLHTKKVALIRDLMHHPEMIAFVEALGDNIQVLRTSGVVDEGWEVQKLLSDELPRAMKIGDQWTISMAKNEESFVDSITKNVRLSAFLDPKLKYATMEKFPDIVDKLIALLEKGIYVDHFNAQAGMVPVKFVPKMSYAFVIAEDGRLGRVFVPELAVVAT